MIEVWLLTSLINHLFLGKDVEWLGKRKIWKAVVMGLVPYQSKYIPETIINETFNESHTKLTRTEIFLDKQRAEQRFIHFLEILNYKLDQPNFDVKIFIKLYNKYKDTIIEEIFKNIRKTKKRIY